MDKQCKCGSKEFYATQRIYVEVVVDNDGNFIRNAKGTIEDSIEDADRITGSLICIKCDEYFKEI